MSTSGSTLDKVNTYSPMDILFKEGDSATFNHIVRKGRILILQKNSKGNQVPLMVITGPCVPDDLAVFENGKHTVTAIALTDCEALLVKHTEMHHVVSQMPSWTQNVMKTIAGKLKDACELVVENNIQDEDVEEAWAKYSKSILAKLK